jgi:hypothetical protein
VELPGLAPELAFDVEAGFPLLVEDDAEALLE